MYEFMRNLDPQLKDKVTKDIEELESLGVKFTDNTMFFSATSVISNPDVSILEADYIKYSDRVFDLGEFIVNTRFHINPPQYDCIHTVCTTVTPVKIGTFWPHAQPGLDGSNTCTYNACMGHTYIYLINKCALLSAYYVALEVLNNINPGHGPKLSDAYNFYGLCNLCYGYINVPNKKLCHRCGGYEVYINERNDN